jgi:hypothetical protein
MARIVGAVGRARPTVHAKQAVAAAMYKKGKSFVGASLLLRRQGGDEYVVLHVLCQGIELVLKAVLLVKDYDRYKSRLKKPLGHNLMASCDAVADAYGKPRLRGSTREQLKTLSKLYEEHLLRYGTHHDIFIDASTIPTGRVMHRISTMLRGVEKQGLFHGMAI